MGTEAPANKSNGSVEGQLSLDRDDLDEVLTRTRDTITGQRGYAMLYGPPGTGKTTSAVASAAADQEVIHYTLRVEASAVEFTGHKEIQNGNTVYWEGLGVQAWRRGALLVLNELNNASEDVLNFLYQLMDDPKIADIRLPNGEVVKPQPGFRVIATMNGMPSELPEAIRDRVGLWLAYDEPSTEMYQRLDTDVRDVLRDEYQRCANARNARDRVPFVTFREAMSFCEVRRAGLFRSERDCAVVALSKENPENVERLMTALQAVGRDGTPGLDRSALLPDGLR